RGAGVGQPAGQRAALVAGDSARHAEDDVTAGQRHQASCFRRTSLYRRLPCTSSSRARVVSFCSKSTERSRGNSLTNRANLAATSTPRYLFCVCSATSLGVMIRITAPLAALSVGCDSLPLSAPARFPPAASRPP